MREKNLPVIVPAGRENCDDGCTCMDVGKKSRGHTSPEKRKELQVSRLYIGNRSRISNFS
jgi:hypothetical protein